jgi:hypothetical protein
MTKSLSRMMWREVRLNRAGNADIVLFFGLGVPPKWLSIILLQAFSYNVADILCFRFAILLLAFFLMFFV